MFRAENLSLVHGVFGEELLIEDLVHTGGADEDIFGDQCLVRQGVFVEKAESFENIS